MNNLVYISDFFIEHVRGGAEIYDDLLIKELEKRSVKVCKFQSHEFTTKHFQLYEKCGFNFLISNFVNLGAHVKKLLQAYAGRYCILEHDHKYLANRNPADFKNFIAPPQMVINKTFYSAASAVFCQSVKHAEVLAANLKINNVVNLGCSLWSEEQINIIRNIPVVKNSKAMILNDSNVIKGTTEAIEVCKSKNIEFDLLEKMPYEEYLASLGKYEKLVFFPKTLESFCRVVVEARMLGCKLMTNSLNGCTYETWFRKLKGSELIDYVDSQRENVISTIKDGLFKTTNDSKEGDITVILNCYRRPYNLKMQVDAIRSQSVKPAQIWLWINYHEDNKDFDPTSLGVDRIFKNDFNWKFYGRFAAALLADTEYVALYDDDTIPGKRWHENCLNTMKTHEGILGSAGIILKGNCRRDGAVFRYGRKQIQKNYYIKTGSASWKGYWILARNNGRKDAAVAKANSRQPSDGCWSRQDHASRIHGEGQIGSRSADIHSWSLNLQCFCYY